MSSVVLELQSVDEREISSRIERERLETTCSVDITFVEHVVDTKRYGVDLPAQNEVIPHAQIE